MHYVKIFTIILLSSVSSFADSSKDNSLDAIFAPKVVAIPPADAGMGLVRLNDGTLRHYNFCFQRSDGYFYIESKNNGLTWRRIESSADKNYGTTLSPISGKWHRVESKADKVVVNKDNKIVAADNSADVTSFISSDLDGNFKLRTLTTQRTETSRQPIFLSDNKTMIVLSQSKYSSSQPKDIPWGCFAFVSTDDGDTWKISNRVTVPDHKAGGVHKGVRWNHNAVEPTMIELKDGRLLMIIRTALDNHWESFSEDKGLTWSAPRASRFYSTGTMPTLLRLSDGKILFIWNNTVPLPEVEGTDGVWEDVFTNRNVLHAAVSDDDGKSWKGFREIRLDSRRNATDYASSHGSDKSVHQAQAVEVAPNKVVVAYGQNPLHRRIMIFDVRFLEQKQRSCDFSNALEDWSVFNYKKGIKGHCGYDRIAGCDLVEISGIGKCLKVEYKQDSSLVDDIRGAVWNFPASHKGELSLRIKTNSKDAKILLSDRWFNPSDATANLFAMYELSLGTLPKKWCDLNIRWDNQKAKVFIDGNFIKELPLKNETQNGISYFHIMSSRNPEEVTFLKNINYRDASLIEGCN